MSNRQLTANELSGWEPSRAASVVPRGWMNRALFCAGTAFVTASQLRITGPFGVGEFLLLVWSVMTLLSPNWQMRAGLGLWPTRVLGLYILLAVIGTPIGLISGAAVFSNTVRFVAALLLVGLMALALTYHSDRDRIIRTWARWWPVLVIVPNFLAWIISRSSPTFLGLTLLEGTYGAYYRFDGLTTNANQLAMIAACAFFLSLATAKQLRYRPWTLVMCFLSLLVGYYSASDGFRVSLLAAGGSYLILTLTERRRTLWGGLRLIGASVVLLIGLVSINGILQSASQLSTAQGDQGSQRVLLWGKCAAVFLRFPLTGVGPTTPANAFGSMNECHNSYLDIATGGGVLALFSMIALLVYLWGKHWRARDPIRLGLITWLMTFMIFGYQGRHPIFWMILIWLSIPESALRDVPRTVSRARRRMTLAR